MLPKELLEVRRVKGRIYPKFADLEKDRPLAEKVIKVFRAGLGKKYGLVAKALKEMENAENFRKVRGFARVLENHCVEKACKFADLGLNPYEVRMFLFERGFVTTKAERDRVIEYAAKYFNATPEEIERAMYADREEELVLTGVEEMDAEELIRRYNLSLLQTALFNSTYARFELSGNYKELFRAIKFLGLMYDIIKVGKLVEVEVIGPASLIKMTRKYGTSLAKLIPYVVSAESWRIEAKVVEGDRIYRLEVDSFVKNFLPSSTPREDYDSSLEAEFCRRMRNLGFLVSREPGVVDAGGRAFIPDFAVWKDGWRGRVYVEIAGFWTADYVKRKAEKVRKAGIPLVVVAGEEFGEVKARSAGFEGLEFIVFSKRIDYGEVVKAVNRLAKKFGLVTEKPEEVRDLREIKDEIRKSRPSSLEELEGILEKHGLKLGDEVLKEIGVKVVWKGLEAELIFE